VHIPASELREYRSGFVSRRWILELDHDQWMPVIAAGDGLEEGYMLYNVDRDADPILAEPTLREEDIVRRIIMFLGHSNLDNGLF
jgi:hypothetical protein